jgi:hypothetical protein
VEGQAGTEELFVAGEEGDERLKGADEEDDDGDVYQQQDKGGSLLPGEQAASLGSWCAKGPRVSLSTVCRLALLHWQSLVFGRRRRRWRATTRPAAKISPGAGHVECWLLVLKKPGPLFMILPVCGLYYRLVFCDKVCFQLASLVGCNGQEGN